VIAFEKDNTMNSGSYKETMVGPIREKDHSQHKKLLDVMPTAVKGPTRDRNDDTIETLSISTGSMECDPQPTHPTPPASITTFSSRRFSGEMENLICDLKNEQSPKQGNGRSMHSKSSRFQDLVSPRGVVSPITPRGSKQLERYSVVEPKRSPKRSPRGDRRSFLPFLSPVSPSTYETGRSSEPATTTTTTTTSRGSPRSDISPRNPRRSTRSRRQTGLESCASSVASPPLSTKSIDWGNGISSSIHEQTQTGRGGGSAQRKHRPLKSQWSLLSENNLTTFEHEVIWPSKTSSVQISSPSLPSRRSYSVFPPVHEEGSAVVQNASCGSMQPQTKSMDRMHSSDSVLLIDPSWLIPSHGKKGQATTRDEQQSKPESRNRSSRQLSDKGKKKTEKDDNKEKRKKRRSKSKPKREQVVESRSRRCSSNPDLEVGEKTTHREHNTHGARSELEEKRPKEDTSGKKKRREGEKKQPLDEHSAHRRKDAREKLASRRSFDNILSSDAPRIVDTKQQVSKSNRHLTSAAAVQESRTMRNERSRVDSPGEDITTLGENRSQDVCPSGEDRTEDVSSGEDPLSRREEYQEAILELCEMMEASIPFWAPEELRVRRHVLVRLLQATSDRETHLTNLTLEDVSEIVGHVRCLEANCEVEWDIIRDIVFPVGNEGEEEEPLAEETPDVGNHVTTDDQREVLKGIQQSFALSEKELFAVLVHVKQLQTNRPA
jgi:hypothetical protein